MRSALVIALGLALVAGCGGDSEAEKKSEAALVARAKIKEAKRAAREAKREARRRAERMREESGVRAERPAEMRDLSEKAWLKERGRMVKDILALMRDGDEEDSQEPPRWLTKPQALQRLRGLGDDAAALALARRMRHSSNSSHRAAALDAFAWLGDKAMPDLTAMLADSDPTVAKTALDAFQQNIGDIEDESLRAEMIVEAAKLVENDSDMDAILMELVSFESPKLTVSTLDRVITAGDTTAVAKETARDTFEHFSGEAYSDSGQAAEVGQRMENEVNTVSLDRMKMIYNKLGIEVTDEMIKDFAAEAEAAGKIVE